MDPSLLRREDTLFRSVCSLPNFWKIISWNIRYQERLGWLPSKMLVICDNLVLSAPSPVLRCWASVPVALGQGILRW